MTITAFNRCLTCAVIISVLQAAARALPADCPINTLFPQPADDSCVAGSSEAGTVFRRWERFHGVAGPITSLRWYGLAARPQGGSFVACDESDHTFEITIAQDVAGAPGPVECTYTLVAIRTPTGLICGEEEESPAQYQYEVALPTPCILVRGWVSILGMGDSNCWFLWHRSPDGDGTSRCEGCANLPESFDLSMCLLGTPGGVSGACCNEVAAACTDNVAMNDCTAAAQRFTPNTLCADITPPCGQLTGACCLIGAPCRINVEVTCQSEGGQWLGPATVCADCLPIGACCQGGSHCTLTEQAPCLDEGHTWLGADTTCADCPPLPTCPTTGVLISHPPFDPLAEPSAFTSEDLSPFAVSENFIGAAGPITALTWWGLDLQPVGNGFVECTETDPTFNIIFRHDAAGIPANQVESYNVEATRTPTGHTYHGKQLNEYHAELPTPCVLPRGWVTISGRGDSTCWFLWMTSPTGDDQAHCAGCIPSQVSSDFAMCLHGTPGGVFGACCVDATTACADNVEIDDCAGASQRFLPGGLCASFDPPCGVIIGACCFAQFGCQGETQTDCQTLGGLWLGANSQCGGTCPCIVECPADGVAEAEPLCVTGYNDQFNAGCTSTPHHFTPVTFGQKVCGVGGFYETGVDYIPDQDWYEIQIPSPLTWTVRVVAELPVRVEIREAGEGCPGHQLGLNQTSFTCQSMDVNATSETPGTHWIVVEAYVGNDASACGANYTLEVVSPNDCIAGDLNQDSHVNGMDIAIFVECVVFGSSPTFNCLCGDMNFDGLTNAADTSLFISRLLQP